MNKRAISVLILINAALLACLVVTLLSPPADAQAIGGGAGKYLLIAGDVQGRTQQAAVYIIDKNSGQLAVVMFNTSNNSLEIMQGRDLSSDLTRPIRPR